MAGIPLAGPWVLEHATPLRLGAFLAFAALFTVAEVLRPRRPRVRPVKSRVAFNYGLMLAGSLVVRLAVPAGAVGAALWADAKGVGLLHGAPETLRWVAAFVGLDLAIYAQHVAFHRIPWLWALHRLHHADVDLDVSSGVRFHPLEILVSMGWKLAVVAAVGFPASAVLIYEAALSCASVATHANIGLPRSIEALARRALVTPDIHRIHHSTDMEESNRNFGAITPLWDRLFGTFLAEPRDGQVGMHLGLAPD